MHPDYKSCFKILKGGKISLVVSALLGATTISFAAPSGGVVTSGSATISQNGTTTNINQSTQKATINWQKFSVASNETVNFNQPNVNSITLNRVIGNEKSIINGALNANGQVWILNSNGVLFGKNASINTAGLLATTAQLSDTDFNAENYRFKNATANSVINEGTITISNSGSVILASNEVRNQGTIKAIKGKVHLVGASEYTVNLNGNSLVNLKVDKGVLDALVENSGHIIADGGEIYLTTNAVNELLKGVVNNTGIIEANSLDGLTGHVELFAHGGEVQVGGSIEAKDGFVETSGKNFTVQSDTKITAKTWLIDPTNVTVDDATAYENSLNAGTDVTIQTDNANGADEGNIVINDSITWNGASKLTLDAFNNIYINNNIIIENVDAELALYYGQGALYQNNTSDYILTGTITTIDSDDFEIVDNGNIFFSNGGKLTEKKGSDGPTITNNFRDVAYVTKQVVSDIQDDGVSYDGVTTPITWTILPEDTHMVALKPTSNDYEIEDVATLFGMTTNSVDYINSEDAFNNDTTNYSIAYQDVELTDGQTLTTAWNYTSTDYDPFNDGSFLSFVNISNNNDHTSTIYGVDTEVMVLGATVEGTGNWSTKSYSSTGWQTASFTAGEAGTYRIGYAVFNLDDTILSPFLVLDTKAGTVLKNGVNFEPISVDPNGPLAKAGVTIGSTPKPTPAPTPTTNNNEEVNKVVTAIVNTNAIKVQTPKITPPVVQPQTIKTTITPTLDLGFGEGTKVSLVSKPLEGEPSKVLTLSDIRAMQTTSPSSETGGTQQENNNNGFVVQETRVALSSDSIVDLVNGGVNLPEGVEQEFYVVEDKRN